MYISLILKFLEHLIFAYNLSSKQINFIINFTSFFLNSSKAIFPLFFCAKTRFVSKPIFLFKLNCIFSLGFPSMSFFSLFAIESLFIDSLITFFFSSSLKLFESILFCEILLIFINSLLI